MTSNQLATYILPPPGPLLGTVEIDGVTYLFHESDAARRPEGCVEVFANEAINRNRVINLGPILRHFLREREK